MDQHAQRECTEDEESDAARDAEGDGRIVLTLDSYDDLFSDFDPRGYHERSLSEDFLRVCRRASRNKAGPGLRLQLLMPEALRDRRAEGDIETRLLDYFQDSHRKSERQLRAARLQGWRWFALGAASMAIAAALKSGDISRFLGLDATSFLFNLLIGAFEPAGWFLFWEGAAQLLKGAKVHEGERNTARKLAAARVEFLGY